MSRYYLILEQKFSKEIEDSLLSLLKEKCLNLGAFKNKELPIKSLVIIPIDDVNEITSIIRPVYELEFISNIVLVDSLKDTVFVYKAEGSLSDIRQKQLPVLLDALNQTIQDDFFFCIVKDIRDVMKLGFHFEPSIN